jgi:hypothetical protein
MQVREVICPSCSHRFMWMDVEEGPTIKKYRSVETGETFHTANPESQHGEDSGQILRRTVLVGNFVII